MDDIHEATLIHTTQTITLNRIAFNEQFAAYVCTFKKRERESAESDRG